MKEGLEWLVGAQDCKQGIKLMLWYLKFLLGISGDSASLGNIKIIEKECQFLDKIGLFLNLVIDHKRQKCLLLLMKSSKYHSTSEKQVWLNVNHSYFPHPLKSSGIVWGGIGVVAISSLGIAFAVQATLFLLIFLSWLLYEDFWIITFPFLCSQRLSTFAVSPGNPIFILNLCSKATTDGLCGHSY